MDNLDLNASAAAMLKLKEEMKGCPVNKSGTYNGNGRSRRVITCAMALQAAGWTRPEAYSMAWKCAPERP